jgi:DNA gyrase inhibitor GyrI
MIAATTGVDVRIVRLEPMNVAAVRAVGETPEIDAWRKLRSWAEPQGLLERHPVFGFSNPGPAPDRDDYGYEYWLPVDRPVPSDTGVELKHFDGGLYAVTTTRLTDVSGSWNDLWDWARQHGYQCRRTHELEEIRNPLSMDAGLEVDLYLPIQG